LEDDERARAGVLGMPGRCSHEKGTEEERSGEGRNRWNGDGDVGGGGGKKETGAKDGKWPFGLDDGKRRRRRRGMDTAEEDGAGDGEAGIEAILWSGGGGGLVAAGGGMHSTAALGPGFMVRKRGPASRIR
jgi:hypothetical protein